MWSPFPYPGATYSPSGEQREREEETQPLVIERDLNGSPVSTPHASTTAGPTSGPTPYASSLPRTGPSSPATHRPKVSSPLRQCTSSSSSKVGYATPPSPPYYPSYSESPWSSHRINTTLRGSRRFGGGVRGGRRSWEKFPTHSSRENIEGGAGAVADELRNRPQELRVENWRKHLEVKGLRRNVFSNLFANLISLAPSGTAKINRRSSKKRYQIGGALEIILHWLFFILSCLVFYMLIATIWAVAFHFLADPTYFLPSPKNFLETFWISIPILSGLFVPTEFRMEDPGKSSWVQTLANLEAFHAEILKAIITGLIFARFSRPGRRVSFSNVAVLQVFPNLVPRPVLQPHEFSEDDDDSFEQDQDQNQNQDSDDNEGEEKEGEEREEQDLEAGREERSERRRRRGREEKRRRRRTKVPKNIRGVLKFRIANETAARINDAKMKAEVVLNSKKPMVSPFHIRYKGSHLPVTQSIEKTTIPLKLKRSNVMTLEHSWTVEHWIDEDSPLYRMKNVEQELIEREAEVSCLFSAHDEDYGESLHIHETYLFGENVMMNHEFLDVFYFLPSGKLCFDLNNLHLTEEIDPETFNQDREADSTPILSNTPR